MESILVVAKPGAKCPRRDPRSPSITDSAPALVPASPFYLRLIADGSLVRVTEKRRAVKAPASVDAEQEPKKKRQKKQTEDDK